MLVFLTSVHTHTDIYIYEYDTTTLVHNHAILYAILFLQKQSSLLQLITEAQKMKSIGFIL